MSQPNNTGVRCSLPWGKSYTEWEQVQEEERLADNSPDYGNLIKNNCPPGIISDWCLEQGYSLLSEWWLNMF